MGVLRCLPALVLGLLLVGGATVVGQEGGSPAVGLHWRLDLGWDPVEAVDDGQHLFVASDDRVGAVALADGRLLWERTLPVFHLEVAGATLIAEGPGEEGHDVVTALDPATGQTRWTHVSEHSGWTQVSAGAVLVVEQLHEGTNLTALEPDSGDIRWTRAFDDPYLEVLAGAHLLVRTVGGLGALHPASGETRWQVVGPSDNVASGPDGPWAMTWVPGGVRVVRYDAGTGALAVNTTIETSSFSELRPVGTGVLVVRNDGPFALLDAHGTGRNVWEGGGRLLGLLGENPVVFDTLGEITALAGEPWRPAWSFNLTASADLFHAVGDRLVVAGNGRPLSAYGPGGSVVQARALELLADPPTAEVDEPVALAARIEAAEPGIVAVRTEVVRSDGARAVTTGLHEVSAGQGRISLPPVSGGPIGAHQVALTIGVSEVSVSVPVEDGARALVPVPPLREDAPALWAWAFGGRITAHPTGTGDLLVVSWTAEDGGSANLEAVSLATGARVWHAPIREPHFSGPELSAHGVHTVSWGALATHDLASGEVLWTRPLFGSTFGANSEVVLVEERGTAAVSAATGALKWRTNASQLYVVTEGEGLAIAGDSFAGIALRDGRELWRRDRPADHWVFPGDGAVALWSNGSITLFEPDSGEVRWQRDLPGSVRHVGPDVVLVEESRGENDTLVVYDAGTGDPLWERELAWYADSWPLGGSVAIETSEGLALHDARTGEPRLVRDRLDLDAITVVGDALAVRSGRFLELRDLATGRGVELVATGVSLDPLHVGDEASYEVTVRNDASRPAVAIPWLVGGRHVAHAPVHAPDEGTRWRVADPVRLVPGEERTVAVGPVPTTEPGRVARSLGVSTTQADEPTAALVRSRPMAGGPAPWPLDRGDAGRSGGLDRSGPGPVGGPWHLGPDPPYRTVAVPGPERVFAVRGDDRLVALDPASGEAVWNVETVPGADHAPIVGQAWVFVASDESVWAHDRTTGARLWNSSEADELGGPLALVGGDLLAVADRSAIKGLDPATGAELWWAEGGFDPYYLATPEDLLMVSHRGVARLVHAGYPEPITLPLAALGAAPVLVDGVLVASSFDGHLVAFEPDGGLRWNVSVGPAAPAAWVVASGERVLAAFHDRVVAVASDDGAPLWSTELAGAYGSRPVLADGRAYILDWDDEVHALALATGEELWTFPLGFWPEGEVVGAHGRLFVLSSDGRLWSIPVAEGKPNLTGLPVPGVGAVALAAVLVVLALSRGHRPVPPK